MAWARAGARPSSRSRPAFLRFSLARSTGTAPPPCQIPSPSVAIPPRRPPAKNMTSAIQLRSLLVLAAACSAAAGVAPWAARDRRRASSSDPTVSSSGPADVPPRRAVRARPAASGRVPSSGSVGAASGFSVSASQAWACASRAWRVASASRAPNASPGPSLAAVCRAAMAWGRAPAAAGGASRACGAFRAVMALRAGAGAVVCGVSPARPGRVQGSWASPRGDRIRLHACARGAPPRAEARPGGAR